MLDDGARICGLGQDPHEVRGATSVQFTLPDRPGEVYSWSSAGSYYTITHEGQLGAHRVAPDVDRATVWLRWEDGRLVASAFRDWRDDFHGPLVGPATTRSALMLSLPIADLATSPEPITPRTLVRDWVRSGELGAATVQAAVGQLLPHESWSPAKAVYILEGEPELLPSLWPLLTEPLRHAAAQVVLPRWANRVLDVAILHQGILAEATRRGHVPSEAWAGVHELAARNGSGSALGKARALAGVLPLG